MAMTAAEYEIKRIGPRTDPCGTPEVTGSVLEVTPLLASNGILNTPLILMTWISSDLDLHQMLPVSLKVTKRTQDSATRTRGVTLVIEPILQQWSRFYQMKPQVPICSSSSTNYTAARLKNFETMAYRYYNWMPSAQM